MSTLNTIRPTFLATTLALLTIPAQAVTVLYSDDFSGDGTANLNSTTPDTTIGTNTWSANTNIKDDGSVAALTTNSDRAAGLAFTPTVGNVYTLSATLAAPTGGRTASSPWFAFGFTDALNTGSIPDATFTSWMLWRTDNAGTTSGDINLFLGLGTGNGFSGNPVATGVTGTQTLSIVLDTTTTLWSVEWFQGASSLGSMDYTANPTISNLFIAGNAGTGFDIDTLSLTVVPEPSTALLGGLGMLALLRRRR
jgi:hypothetical protein